MKNFDLLQLCSGLQWPKVRKYLSSDAAEEEKKSNVKYRDGDERTCLHAACSRGAPDDVIQTMLAIGGKELVMMTKNDDWTALHSVLCIVGASYNIIKMLIEVGGKDLVMAKSKKGNTALHFLCWSIGEHTKVAEKINLILQVGDANLLLSTKDNDGQTPLEIVTDNGASKRIKKLLTEHEEGEGTVVVQSQTQSLKRRRVGNTINASSPSLNSNQAEDDDDDDAAIIAGQLDQYNILMSRHLATRRELRSAKAQIAELKQEIEDLAILER
jgi:ankyrin repeat protein